MEQQLDLAHLLTQVALEMAQPQTVDETLDTIVQAARRSLDHVDHVGIAVVRPNGRVETHAASDDVVRRLDKLQYDVGEGPCLDALATGRTVRVEHAATDPRWPAFLPAAVELGVLSQVGLRLGEEGRIIGALNLYSTSSPALDDEMVQLAEMFAVHATLALGRVRSESQLQFGLSSRTDIGQAMGILMERYQLDRDNAFGFLTRASTTSNTKLRDVASRLVLETERSHTRAKPG